MLGKATCFSSLDLRSGYWQVAVDEKYKRMTAFYCHCHMGLFQFRVMSFGLAGAPGVFQSLMAVVLRGLGHFAMAYQDDILIFSKTPEEHFKYLKTVLERLKHHGLI